MTSSLSIPSALVYSADALLRVARLRERLVVLIYHRVLREPDPMRDFDVDAAAFDWQMQLLSRAFTVLPLHEALTRLEMGKLPRRAVCITFDDGYRDNHEVAFPILKRWGLPATFFIASGYLDGGAMWNDVVIEAVRRAPGPELDLRVFDLGVHRIADMARRAEVAMTLLLRMKYMESVERAAQAERLAEKVGVALPKDLMMRSEQVRALREGGMDIGGHTVSHPILTRVSDDDAWREISLGKRHLEDIVGARIVHFAYPNGRPNKDYTEVHVKMAQRAGFKAAFSTAWGSARANMDRWQLPRVMPWEKTPVGFGLRLIRSFADNPVLSEFIS